MSHTARLWVGPNFNFVGCGYLCSVHGGGKSRLPAIRQSESQIKISLRFSHIWSRAASRFFNISAFFLTELAPGNKLSIWKCHGNTTQITLVYLTLAIANLPPVLCKMDKPHYPRLPSHLWVYMHQRLFFLEVSAHRISQIIKAAHFCLIEKTNKLPRTFQMSLYWQSTAKTGGADGPSSHVPRVSIQVMSWGSARTLWGQ